MSARMRREAHVEEAQRRADAANQPATGEPTRRSGRDRWVRPFFKQYRKALAVALALGVATFCFASGLMFTSGYLIAAAAEMPGSILMIHMPHHLRAHLRHRQAHPAVPGTADEPRLGSPHDERTALKALRIHRGRRHPLQAHTSHGRRAGSAGRGHWTSAEPLSAHGVPNRCCVAAHRCRRCGAGVLLAVVRTRHAARVARGGGTRAACVRIGDESACRSSQGHKERAVLRTDGQRAGCFRLDIRASRRGIPEPLPFLPARAARCGRRARPIRP